MSPEPDEDFVDPEDNYNMPWEDSDCETGNDRMPVKEDETFAAAIGLEVTGSAEFTNILIEEFQDIFSASASRSPSARRHDRYCQVA